MTNCRRCGRTLTSARALREAATNGGYGRGCAAKVTAALGADKPAVRADAAQLIEDEGVARVTGALWLAVSTDGTVYYEVCPVTGRCTCRAGQYGRRCFHLAAVEAVSGVTSPAALGMGPARPVDPTFALAA